MKRMIRCLGVFLCLVFAAGSQVAPSTIADITGDAATHQFATAGTALWVLIVTPASNSGPIRIGDANISATRGAQIAAGGGLMLPKIESTALSTQYDLSKWYYYAAAGDKISIMWVK